MSLAPGTRFGSYEVTAALKVLPDSFVNDPDRLARFQREAHVLASLNHPNIAAIYGVEDVGSTRALVMELVDGSTLAERTADGPIHVDEAIAIATQIAEALGAAHDQGAARHCCIHEPRAGQGTTGRQAKRRVGIRMRLLRDADRAAGACA